MRLPFLQVAAETWEDAATLAGLLSAGEGDAFKLLCDARRWGLGLGPDDQAPTGVCDSPRASKLLAAACRWPLERADELVEALEDIGAVEVLGGGRLRIKGMDRYEGTWRKNRRKGHGKDAPEEPPPAPRSSPARVPPGPRSVPDRQTQTQTQTQTHKERQLPLSAEQPADRAVVVFEFWRKVMGKNARTAFDQKRRKAVEARLADGYTVDDLQRAIEGCAATPHNMGQNDRHERFDDLELICRDAAHVDRFRATAAAKKPAPTRPDHDALIEAVDIAKALGDPQLPKQLAAYTWVRDGDRLRGTTPDQFHAAWLAETYGSQLGVLAAQRGVTLVIEAHRVGVEGAAA